MEEVEEEVPMERVVKYLPIGNHKWCAYPCRSAPGINFGL